MIFPGGHKKIQQNTCFFIMSGLNAPLVQTEIDMQ